jgi:hypothetical protein
MAVPEQKAQFDASKGFDVVGCDSGRRYCISHGTGTNVHEIDDAGRSWAGVLSHRGTWSQATSCLLKKLL